MKRFFFFSFLMGFISLDTSAQYSLTTTTYSQTFDGLGTSTSPSITNGDLNNINTSLNGWYFSESGTNANTIITAGTGSSATGDTYNFGAAAGSNRTLGGLQSGALIPSYGFWFTNNTGGTIQSLSVGYTGETWRIGATGRSDQIDFQYSTNATSLTTGIWTDFDLLDYVIPAQGATGNGSLQHFSVLTQTISGLSIANGTSFFIRWTDANAAGSDDGMGVNDFAFTATLAPANTITTGTVSTPPFTLANCTATASGTVAFTSTDVFTAGNTFTAQLSDDIGSFASPINIGSLSGAPAEGTAPSGNISITIPAGTVGGTGYKIRVVSSNPSVTGSSSAAFTITQQGVGGCASSHTDYYRSFQSGNWATVTTWESSPNNINWIPATLTPTYLANDITIITGHTVIISSSITVDEVAIDFGSILEHTGGTLTIEDGDINIGSGGVFVLSSANNPPLFASVTATVQVPTFGILRVSAGGLTSAAPANGVNVSNFVYYHQSILEYTLSGGFSTNNVIYFPNVNATTIPIFRATNPTTSNLIVGSNNPTIFNGVFEYTSTTADLIWQNTGDKTFRNGIKGGGNFTANASAASAKFIINGTTAEIGGTGSLVVPTTGGLEIGASTTVTMTSDKTITGNVSLLTNTYVELANYNLTVSGTVSNATLTSYVKTNGTGKLTLNVGSGLGGKLFPIGLTSINPLYISSNPTANYSARIVEPITPVIFNSNEAVLRTWYISSPANSPSASISFGYAFPGDCGVSYNNTGPVEVGVNVSGVWNIHETGLTPANFILVPGTFIVSPATPITYFNGTTTEFPFVVANNGAVLSSNCIISTRAQKRNNTGIISWTVNSCAEVRSFEVQRSVGNGGFQTMAIIRPTINETDFNFTDPSLAKGTNLYRIKVNGINGSSKYSNTVALIYDSDELLITSIAPNPVHDIAKLTLTAAKQGLADFKVYNIAGSLVKQWHSGFAEGNTTLEINVAELSAGIYQLLVSTANSKTVTRFVKQ